MTHRTLIQSIGRLTPDVRCVLQVFYTVDLSTCRITVAPRPPLDDSNGRTGPGGVYMWEDVWAGYAPNVLVILSHELTHWEQARTQGWLTVLGRWVATHATSLLFSRQWYDPQRSSDERAAYAVEMRVKTELTDYQLRILDREVR